MQTIKDYAKSVNVSYEAVRKQVKRYELELNDHILKKGRTQYLDDYAIEFLTSKRADNPIVVLSSDKDAEIEEQKRIIDNLRVELLELNKEYKKLTDEIRNKDNKIQLLQEEKIQLLEQRQEPAKKGIFSFLRKNNQ